MEDIPEKQEELKETEPKVDFTEKKKLLPKNFLLYSITLLWSFFLVFIIIYFMTYRNQKKTLQNNSEQTTLVQDSTTVFADSTQLATKDSIIETNAKNDSSEKFYIPPEGFLTSGDEMEILKLENGRRKREIDYLWNELRIVKKSAKDLEEKTLAINSSQIDTRSATPAVAVNLAEARQEQLSKEKLDEEKKLKEQAEIDKKEKALAASAKLYSNMKPKLAATILTQFDDKEVANMLLKLRERQAAKILEQMETSKAIQICKLMAK